MKHIIAVMDEVKEKEDLIGPRILVSTHPKLDPGSRLPFKDIPMILQQGFTLIVTQIGE